MVAPLRRGDAGLARRPRRPRTSRLPNPGVRTRVRHRPAANPRLRTCRLRNGSPGATDDQVEQRVELRMNRQQILHRPDAPKLWVIMDQSVLHRPVGGAELVREQIDHLLAATANLPNISLPLVPNHDSGYAAETPFSLLRFTEPELPNLVYVEYHSNAQYIDDRKETEPHIRAFDRLMVDAETPDRPRQLLDKHRNDLS